MMKEAIGSPGSGMASLGIAASSDVRATLGDVGSAMVIQGAQGILIVQRKEEPVVDGRLRED